MLPTATVVDSNGNTVADYNGNVTLTTTGNASAIVDPTNSAEAAGTETVAAKNGVATFTLASTGDAAGVSDTLTGTADYNGAALAQGTTTITTTAATPESVSLSAFPSTLDVNQGGLSTQVNISINDQAGNTYSGVSEPVTLTLTGPGSFVDGASVKTTALYIDGTGSVYVYGTQNGTGTISVNATSGSLKAGSTSINAINVGAPAKLAVTSQAETTSAGAPFTLYTVQLEDASGNPITGGTGAGDYVELSDNSASVDGTLNYYGYNASSGQPTTALPMTNQLVNGQLQFAVENTTAGTGPATITVKDISESVVSSATAPYDFQIGSPTSVSLTPDTATNVVPGQKLTFTAQLTDSNGNDIKQAGQSVTFYFDAGEGNSAKATLPNGNAGTGSANGYTAVTNADGIATASVTVPATSASGAFQVDAQVGTNSPVDGKVNTIEALANYATGLSFSTSTLNASNSPVAYTWPTNNDITAGTGLTTPVYITPTNGVGEAAGAGDTLEVTTSNPAVLEFLTGSLHGWNEVPGSGGAAYTYTVPNSVAPIELPAIQGMLAGTATITVSDQSNPSVAAVSQSLNVIAGTTATGAQVLYNGEPVSNSNPLTVQGNTPVEVEVEQTDAGGNAVMATTSPVDMELPALNSGTSFRTSENGATITGAQIPVGAEMTSVYLVSPVAYTYTSLGSSFESTPGTAANMYKGLQFSYTGPNGNSHTVNSGTSNPSVPANTTLTVTGQVVDANSDGVPNATVTVDLGSTALGTAVTNASGDFTATVTPTSAVSASALTVSTDGFNSFGQQTESPVVGTAKRGHVGHERIGFTV